MKKISVMIPCYNEEENVVPISEAVIAQLDKMDGYDYEILFIDNCSRDLTRERIRELCAKNKRIRAIFNSANFGQFNSPFYGLCQTSGDCTVSICCDFQDPVDMIPRFVKEWERGYKIVCAVKTSSRENGFVYALRSLYYKLIRKISRVGFIEHFTGFGLYDKSFIGVLRELDDPTPFLRGIVAELGSRIKILEYEQQSRRSGKTSNNFFSLYDAAMLSFTSYTKTGVRAMTFVGMLTSGASALTFLVGIILKIVGVLGAPSVALPIVISIFFMGGLVLFSLGLVGEYVMSINLRTMRRPLVIEEERINFDK